MAVRVYGYNVNSKQGARHRGLQAAQGTRLDQGAREEAIQACSMQHAAHGQQRTSDDLQRHPLPATNVSQPFSLILAGLVAFFSSFLVVVLCGGLVAWWPGGLG
jgi:hypothetical protein